MKKLKVLFSVLALTVASTVPGEACTDFIVGKKASADGSVIISYAADSYGLYGELYHWPAATWPKGTMLDIKEWDTGKPLGQIPQVERTYSVVGNMNEHQLAITESTFGGRPELVDTTGTSLKSLLSPGALYCDLEAALGKPIELVTVSTLEQKAQMPSEAQFRETVIRERVNIYDAA